MLTTFSRRGGGYLSKGNVENNDNTLEDFNDDKALLTQLSDIGVVLSEDCLMACDKEVAAIRKGNKSDDDYIV